MVKNEEERSKSVKEVQESKYTVIEQEPEAHVQRAFESEQVQEQEQVFLGK